MKRHPLSIAGVALVMAILGVFGVLSFIVTQRTRELGIRIALGASSGAVQRMVVRRGLALVFTGLAAGLVCACVGDPASCNVEWRDAWWALPATLGAFLIIYAPPILALGYGYVAIAWLGYAACDRLGCFDLDDPAPAR